MAEDREGPCPVARGLSRVGDSWSMLILRDAGFGVTRFDQFRASLGIAPNILARRLKALTEAGLLEKKRYSERPPRDEYLLTEAGRDFLPVLQVIGAWGSKHHGSGGVTRPIDADTGRTLEPIVVDRETGRPIDSFRISLAKPDGQAARPDRKIHAADLLQERNTFETIASMPAAAVAPQQKRGSLLTMGSGHGG